MEFPAPSPIHRDLSDDSFRRNLEYVVASRARNKDVTRFIYRNSNSTFKRIPYSISKGIDDLGNPVALTSFGSPRAGIASLESVGEDDCSFHQIDNRHLS